MKSPAELLDRVRALYEGLEPRGRVFVWAGGIIGVIFVLFLFGAPAPRPPEQKSAPAGNVREENAYFLEKEVEQKAYVARLEAQYFEVAKKNQALVERVEEVQSQLNELSRARSAVDETAAGLDSRIAAAVRQEWLAQKTAESTGGTPGVDLKDYQLQVININPVKVQARDTVYLPVGSFVRATLLTGVYAPGEAANPLPVLIRLNEAFYGPNEVRIPLEGAFAVGKAAGDLSSERALVQITTLSASLPTGEIFEHKGNIGYLTDSRGQLGIKGVVVHNTGGALGMSFMTGFMGGASQALADAQTTTVTTDNGHAARNVTGSRAKNAAFQGMAESASKMSQYYQDQLEKIIPAVKVEAGTAVYLVILEGVEVHGLKRNDHCAAGFID